MNSTLIVQSDPFTAQVKLFEKTKLMHMVQGNSRIIGLLPYILAIVMKSIQLRFENKQKIKKQNKKYSSNIR